MYTNKSTDKKEKQNKRVHVDMELIILSYESQTWGAFSIWRHNKKWVTIAKAN